MYYRIYPLFNGIFGIRMEPVNFFEQVCCFAFLLVDERGEMTLVDTGFASEHIPGLNTSFQQDPSNLLPAAIARLGRDASQVKEIIMTHLHWDHTGGMKNFPRACFLVQGDDLRTLFHLNPNEETYYCPADWMDLLPRFVLLKGNQEIKPGIRVVHSGGHTAGHQLVEVNTRSGPVLLAGDAPFDYSQLWQTIPLEKWKEYREGPGACFYWNDRVRPTLQNWLEKREEWGPVQGSATTWSEIKETGLKTIISHDPALLGQNCIE